MQDPQVEEVKVRIEFAKTRTETGRVAFRHGAPVVVDGLIRIETEENGVLFVSVAQLTKISPVGEGEHKFTVLRNI